MSAHLPDRAYANDETRPVVREGVFPWLPWPLRAMPSWTTPIRAERLAMMRIGLALFLLLDVLTSYWPLRRVFFGPDSLGDFDQYEWYSQKSRQWWSILRGPANDLNFTLAFFGAIGLAVWIVLDTRTRWLGSDPRPPRPSPWLVALFAFFSAYAIFGYWIRVMRDKELAAEPYRLAMARAIDEHLEKHELGLVYGGDAPVRVRIHVGPGLPDRTPDTGFISWERLKQAGHVGTVKAVPDLAVVVITEQTPAAIREEIADLFNAGVRLVWIIYPKTARAQIDVYTSPHEKHTLPSDGDLDGGAVLPGFILPLEQLQRMLRTPMFRTWMWLAPMCLTLFAILIWVVEAWVTYGLDLPAPKGDNPPRRYLTGWYVVAWGVFPLLVLMGVILSDIVLTEETEGNLIRVALEPPLFHHGMIDLCMIVWMIALLCLMVGFQTRVAAVISWILSTSFANVHPHIDNAGDTIRGIVLFYLILCPCGAVWSVDSLLRQRFSHRPRPEGAAVEVSSWPMCLLFMQLVVMYFMNGLYKVFTADWRHGRTLYFVLNDTTLTRFAFTELPVTYEMTRWLTWSVLAWELSFPVLAINKYTRILALIFGVGFHLGIGISMDLGFFVPYALSIYLIFVPWERWADARWRRTRETRQARE